ncbi:uncharacterized protein LOC108828892 [Raphanus sativus]|uniref:Uncharacterized protein LOC108828892 n=1 Tax=Raphanus sativus TaxID=3726 RepID=A0A9W3DKE5_RAPSA|nr:uncharacterized protein LOC108828892 [Raphanus sativus]
MGRRTQRVRYRYRPRTSAKSQVLADFLVELPTKAITNKDPNSTWLLHVDGSSSKQGYGIGIRLTSPSREILEQSFRLKFQALNNEAEYEALIAGLRLAHGLKIRNIHAYCDSQLVAKYSGEYEARDERMEAYLKLVQNLSQDFDSFALTRIPRSENMQADALAALASSSDPGLKRIIPVEFIEHPSIGPPVIINLIQDDNEDENAVKSEETLEQNEYGCDAPWLEAIRAYIIDGKLPPEKWAARKVGTQAARYVTVDGEIYKWKFSGPLMTCLEGHKARKVMEEVHAGSCGNHSGVKIKRHGYYWPTMIGDCEKFTRKCEKCQRHAPTIRQPAEELSSITSPYPFMRWDMDIVASSQVQTKTLPAGPHRFLFKMGRSRIIRKSTPTYPQCNGQAETINKTVLDGLKKRLDEKKGRWAEELEGVLWSHRTTPRRGTGETPFALVYGTECMIPAEVEFPGIRRRLLPEREEINNAMLLDNLDLVNEQRDRALTRIQNYQHAAAKYYNSNVRNRRFHLGDLVLRKVFQNTAERNAGKLGANWEGPYKIIKVVRPGS